MKAPWQHRTPGKEILEIETPDYSEQGPYLAFARIDICLENLFVDNSAMDGWLNAFGRLATKTRGPVMIQERGAPWYSID